MHKYITAGKRVALAAALLFSGSVFAGAAPTMIAVTGAQVHNVQDCSDINAGLAAAGPSGWTIDGTVSFLAPNPTADTSINTSFSHDYTAPDGATFHIDYDAPTHTASWSSSAGMDAVALKGGNGFNIYAYDPSINGVDNEANDATSGSALITPQLCGPDNTQNCGFSHMVFCYDYHLVVSKTAAPHFTRTHNWTLTKTVSPSSLNLFNGDSGDVGYTVSAQEDLTPPVDSFFTISGTVTISNPWPVAANIASIADQLSDGTVVTLSCATGTLAAGSSENCSYSQAISTAIAAGDSRTNTVTVTTAPGSQVSGGSASATATFATPTTENRTSITVSDSDSSFGPWTFSASGSTQYGKTFNCAGQGSQRTFSYDFGNTVTDQYSDSASANVHVDCYSLAVSKTAATDYVRSWTWNINKSFVSPGLTVDTDGDHLPDALLLATGQNVTLNYNVVLGATSVDSNFGVTGAITINNNDPARDALVSLSDVLPTATALTITDCGANVVVPMGSNLVCHYTAAMPSSTAQTNTATALQQNYHFDASGNPVAAGTMSYSGTAAVSFASSPSAGNLVDRCVNVSDLFNGLVSSTLATNLCAPIGTGPATFTAPTIGYAVNFTWDAALGTCRTIAVPNVASFVAGSGANGSSNATINITNQSCALGCTLTQGYWKTHSKYGPAAHSDPDWSSVGGPDATFFYSAQSWYQVFWTPPSGGNVYYSLAHQYEAAVLNGFNGASEPAQVQDAVNTAFLLFNNPANTPLAIGKLKSTAPLRQQFISLSALLDMYNNGNYPGGPQHCTEDSTSSSAL